MRTTYYRIVKKLDFDDSLTVDFQDIFDGPAAIQAVPMSMWRGMVKGSKSSANGVPKGSFDVENDRRRRGADNGEEEEEALYRRQRSPYVMETV